VIEDFLMSIIQLLGSDRGNELGRTCNIRARWAGDRLYRCTVRVVGYTPLHVWGTMGTR